MTVRTACGRHDHPPKPIVDFSWDARPSEVADETNDIESPENKMGTFNRIKYGLNHGNIQGIREHFLGVGPSEP